MKLEGRSCKPATCVKQNSILEELMLVSSLQELCIQKMCFYDDMRNMMNMQLLELGFSNHAL